MPNMEETKTMSRKNESRKKQKADVVSSDDLVLLPDRGAEATKGNEAAKASEPDPDKLSAEDKVQVTLTRAQIMVLPGRERIPYVKALRVFPAWWNPTLEAIKECHEENDGESEPQCMIVTGPTGAGKSTLVKSYRDRYPQEEVEVEEDGEIFNIQRVVYVSTPSPARITELAGRILESMGDPLAWHRDTLGERRARIKELFGKCGVEMLIVDELQHFINRDGKRKVLLTVTDWFKDLIKETGVACVFVGLPEAEEVLKANPQLARLFGDPYTIAPFEWDEKRPATILEFRTLLHDIEAMLPLKEASYLSATELAYNCYQACGGVFGLLMKLIRSAAIQALKTGKEQLDYPLLAWAFNKKLAGERRGVANPFVDLAAA
jgi:type II secretory pathway predicted ATPase ExeA